MKLLTFHYLLKGNITIRYLKKLIQTGLCPKNLLNSPTYKISQEKIDGNFMGKHEIPNGPTPS